MICDSLNLLFFIVPNLLKTTFIIVAIFREDYSHCITQPLQPLDKFRLIGFVGGRG